MKRLHEDFQELRDSFQKKALDKLTEKLHILCSTSSPVYMGVNKRIFKRTEYGTFVLTH